MLSKDEKEYLLKVHSQSKKDYFMQLKQQEIIETAITCWSKSKDANKDKHIEHLQAELSKHKLYANQFRASVRTTEEKLKANNIRFSALEKNFKRK